MLNRTRIVIERLAAQRADQGRPQPRLDQRARDAHLELHAPRARAGCMIASGRFANRERKLRALLAAVPTLPAYVR